MTESGSIIEQVRAAESEASAEVAAARERCRQAVAAAEAESLQAADRTRRMKQKELADAIRRAEAEAVRIESDSAQKAGSEVESVARTDPQAVDRAARSVVEALKQRWRSNR